MRAESVVHSLPVGLRGREFRSHRAKMRDLLDEMNALRVAMKKVEAELAATRYKEAVSRHLATHDMLTGLPNRRFFQGCLEQILHPGPLPPPKLALLYIDLNEFKAVNDSLGHVMGDRLLKIAANRLKHSIRKDDMLFRLGGDEFGCLLNGMDDRREVTRVASKAFKVLGAPLRLGNARRTISASIGIALSPADDDDALPPRATCRRCNVLCQETSHPFYFLSRSRQRCRSLRHTQGVYDARCLHLTLSSRPDRPHLIATRR